MFKMELTLPDGFAGHLMVEVPRHTDRLRVLATTGAAKLKQQAEDATEEEKLEIFGKNAPVLLDVYEMARPCIKSAHVCKVAEGKEDEVIVSSVDEFERNPATTMAPLQFAAQYLAGFGPGNG